MLMLSTVMNDVSTVPLSSNMSFAAKEEKPRPRTERHARNLLGNPVFIMQSPTNDETRTMLVQLPQNALASFVVLLPAQAK